MVLLPTLGVEGLASYRELSMIGVKEILRGRAAGHSLRHIVRETGMDRKTVRRYVLAAGPQEPDDGVLQRVVQ